MHKLFLAFFLLLILFMVGIAIANNTSLERPLDPYLSPIYDLFTKPDETRDVVDNNIKPISTNVKHLSSPTPKSKSLH